MKLLCDAIINGYMVQWWNSLRQNGEMVMLCHNKWWNGEAKMWSEFLICYYFLFLLTSLLNL